MATPQIGDEIRAAGDFTLSEAKLLTSGGLELDIKPNIMQLTFHEDVQRNSVTGEILIQDAAGYVNIGPIMGQEYLKLKIHTPSLRGDIDTIDFTENVFLINSVENRIEVGNDVSAYALSFTSSEIVSNQRTRVNKALNGTFADIVKEMFEELNCRKKVFIEPTKGIKRIISPNLTPFDVINLAAHQATSKFDENPTPNYIFFETLKGYHFRSLSSLYAQPITHTYDTYIPGTQANLFVPGEGYIRIERELAQIIGHEMVGGNDSLFNYTTGVYGSKLISHNIYTKSYKEYVYNYFDNFGREKHIASFHEKTSAPLFSETPVQSIDRVSDFPARTYLTSISAVEKDTNNTTAYGTEPFDAYDPENSLQERISTLNQLNRGVMINIATHGNTSINVGDNVKVDIPLTSAVDYGAGFQQESNDRFYSGVFLIKKIEHSFDFGEKKHKSILSLVKDSFGKKLPASNLIEPKPRSGLNVSSSRDIFYPQI